MDLSKAHTPFMCTWYDKIYTADAVCDVVLSQLSNKKPKIPPVCVELLVDAITAFGRRAMPVKQLINQLPTMFESTNSGVRDKAMTLIVEIAKRSEEHTSALQSLMRI